MAATYTEVTLEDMERFLRRAYNVYRPKKGESRGEVYYDLNLSKGDILVRVWTSIRPRSGVGAEKGTDAIRVTMVTKGGKPLVPKGTIVKRTQNWRTSLQSRIDDLLDDYEAKTDYWKNRQKDRDNAGGKDEEEDSAAPLAPPSPGREGPHSGIFARLPDDTWGAKIYGQGSPGDKAILERRDRSTLTVTLREKVFEGKDRYTGKYSELWSFDKGRSASGVDITVALVVERMLASVDSNGLDRDEDDPPVYSDVDNDGMPDDYDQSFDAF